MAKDINNTTARALGSLIDNAKDQAAANAKASLIVELSTITLLIDEKITTHEKAIQKIKETREWLSDRFPADAELDQRIAHAIELLQHHVKGTKPQDYFLTRHTREPRDQTSTNAPRSRKRVARSSLAKRSEP
jgi:hypothetical protein